MRFATIASAAGKLSFRRCSLTVAFAVAIAASLAAVPTVFASGESEHERDLGPGCAPERRAIAHRAGGVVVRPHDHERAPIPCVTATGFRTSEIAIVITNNGTILFQPALASEMTGLPIGLLSSVDRGASWEFIDPSPPIIPRLTGHDMTMFIDRRTGRVFWNSSNGPPFGSDTPPRVDYSDDEGRTWLSSTTPPVLFDDAHVFAGPPPERLRHQMRGFPDVVYLCVSGGFTCTYHDFCGTHCTKSLDGARTWEPAIGLPFPPECPLSLRQGGYLSYGAVGRDGTVYLPFTPCQRPYVAISHDEGATWRLALVADTETIGFGELPLGMDRGGNLYAAWVGRADRLPYLAISRDRGLHWSRSMMIASPGVNEAAVPQLVAGARGQVAVSYYGSQNSPGRPFPPPCAGVSVNCPGYENEIWSTYVSESFNALDRSPLFWSATLNDPAQPTWYGVTPSEIGVLGQPDVTGGAFAGGVASGEFASIGGPSLFGRIDYYGMTMAPNDTPWVGFVQECPNGLPVAGNPNCPSTLTGTATDGLFGLVGRLVHVREEAEHHEDD
jgi:hypothetical protein